jgi:zinc-finger-containing domain
MKIFCSGCNKDIEAILTSGLEIYPHRPDLENLPFWKCPTCKNFVGCHHKTKNNTRPLGNIPTKELRKARSHIHAILDPIWKTKKMSRSELYFIIEKKLGYPYHTAEIRTIEEARKVYLIIKSIKLYENQRTN